MQEWQLVEPSQIAALGRRVADWPAVVLDLEATGTEPYLGDKPVGIGVGNYADEKQYYLPTEGLNPHDLRPLIEPLQTSELIGHNIKYDLHMSTFLGWKGTQEMLFDTMVMGRIWSREDHPQLGLKEMAAQVLGYEYQDPETVLLVKKGRVDKVPLPRLAKYCCEDVWCTRELYRFFKRALSPEQLKLFQKECLVTRDLYDLERRGQLIDLDYLEKLSGLVRERQELLIHSISKEAESEAFNPNSSQQVGRLMEKLGIPPVSKTPTGAASWDRENLLSVAKEHPVALDLARYVALTYIRSNMITRCENTVAAGFRALHGTFQQTAVTGRLRSSGPNRQNDPPGWLQFSGDDVLTWAEGAAAKEKEFSIERLFIARPGYVLVSSDYRQIEMYVLGFYMKDPVFFKWLASGNVHAAVAADVWGDAEKFYDAGKTFNFAMVYGTGDKANAIRLKLVPKHVSETGHQIRNFRCDNCGYSALDHTAEMRKQYFARMPGYPKFQRRVMRLLNRDGFVSNVYDREYWIDPDRAYVAVNYLSQGSAGDFVKQRMPATREFRKQNGIYILKTTHDDFVFEVPKESMGALPELLLILAESPFGRKLELDVEYSTTSMVDMKPWTGELAHATR